MPVPVSSLQPLGNAVVEPVAEWITMGAVWPLLGLYLCLSGGDYLLQRLVELPGHRRWIRRPPRWSETRERLRTWLPSMLLASALPAFEIDEYGCVYFTETARLRTPQAWLRMAADVLFEEALFRWVPLLVAGLLAMSPTLFIVAGTVVWGLLHGARKGVTLLVTKGWLLAALWLQGHGVVAVGLHLANNLGVWTLGRALDRV